MQKFRKLADEGKKSVKTGTICVDRKLAAKILMSLGHIYNLALQNMTYISDTQLDLYGLSCNENPTNSNKSTKN